MPLCQRVTRFDTRRTIENVSSTGLVVASDLEFHFTPKQASWLNMVEIEIGVMVRHASAVASPKGDAHVGDRRLAASAGGFATRARGCHAHLRRYFHEALPTAPIARELIDLILGLYRVEHDAKEQKVICTNLTFGFDSTRPE